MTDLAEGPLEEPGSRGRWPLAGCRGSAPAGVPGQSPAFPAAYHTVRNLSAGGWCSRQCRAMSARVAVQTRSCFAT